MKQTRKKFFIVGLFLLAMSRMFITAQEYRMDAGIGGGISFYMGDANPATPFHRSQPAYGIVLRRSLSPRYALKAHLYEGKVEGDTRDFDNSFGTDENGNPRFATFSKTIWDLGLHLEFNFLNYGQPEYVYETARFSPYIFAGVGLCGITEEGAGSSNTVLFSFPFGIGVKYKLFPRINVGVEWSMHRLFNDKLDTMRDNQLLDDPYNIGKNSGKNTDWYSFATLTLTYDLFEKIYCK